MIPIIIEGEKEISPHNLNLLLEAMTPLPLIVAKWIDAFVSIAKACNEVSSFEGLMEHLKEDDTLLYDFVNMMKKMYNYEENKVTIDGTYFRFFKTYENKIFRDIDTEELISAFVEFEPLIKKTKRFAKKVSNYIAKTSFIKRKNIKSYRKNFRILSKSAENITIDPNIVKDLMQYVPNKLLPIALVLENLQ